MLLYAFQNLRLSTYVLKEKKFKENNTDNKKNNIEKI